MTGNVNGINICLLPSAAHNEKRGGGPNDVWKKGGTEGRMEKKRRATGAVFTRENKNIPQWGRFSHECVWTFVVYFNGGQVGQRVERKTVANHSVDMNENSTKEFASAPHPLRSL